MFCNFIDVVLVKEDMPSSPITSYCYLAVYSMWHTISWISQPNDLLETCTRVISTSDHANQNENSMKAHQPMRWSWAVQYPNQHILIVTYKKVFLVSFNFITFSNKIQLHCKREPADGVQGASDNHGSFKHPAVDICRPNRFETQEWSCQEGWQPWRWTHHYAKDREECSREYMVNVVKSSFSCSLIHQHV